MPFPNYEIRIIRRTRSEVAVKDCSANMNTREDHATENASTIREGSVSVCLNLRAGG